MKNGTYLLVLLVALALPAWADTPVGPMNYQGRLLNNGIPVGYPTPTTANFVVRVYDAANGGVLKYQETHSNVTVDDGVYNFLVGTQTKQAGDSTWSVELWNCCANLYLEITANGETLLPRSRLAAAPYAFQANLALTTNNALALGGKSAADYNSVLSAICESSKGKWLELVQKCLGAGSSFPGPAMVNLNTLTASTNLSGLDLTNANISGINFGSANFSGAIFKGSTFNGAGVGSTNMSNAVWDGVSFVGAVTLANNFSGAKISNVNMTGWSLSGASLSNASISDLSACPSSLPANYACRLQKYNSNKYIILGPGINLSDRSLMNNRINNDEINSYLFDSLNLSGASFRGNRIEQFGISSSNLGGASFKQAQMRNSFINNSVLDGTTFSESSLYNVSFNGVSASAVQHLNLVSSELNRVSFSAAPGVQYLEFLGVMVNDVEFTSAGGSFDLILEQNSSYNNIRILAPTTNIWLFSATVSGGIYFGSQVSGLTMENVKFVNGNIGGNLQNAHDESSTYTNVSFYGANLTGATGFNTNIYTNVNWYGAICPDGYQVTTLTGTCVGHFVP